MRRPVLLACLALAAACGGGARDLTLVRGDATRGVVSAVERGLPLVADAPRPEPEPQVTTERLAASAGPVAEAAAEPEVVEAALEPMQAPVAEPSAGAAAEVAVAEAPLPGELLPGQAAAVALNTPVGGSIASVALADEASIRPRTGVMVIGGNCRDPRAVLRIATR